MCCQVIVFVLKPQPPVECNTIPSGRHVAEWYFESTKKCLIPGKYFGDEKKENDDLQPEEKTITSDDAVGGKLITFSFHCEKKDQIKCYMYWNGQCVRFYPQDIIQIFKYMFVPKQYERFKQSKNWKDIMQDMILFKDCPFETFYKSLEKGNKLPLRTTQLTKLLKKQSRLKIKAGDYKITNRHITTKKIQLSHEDYKQQTPLIYAQCKGEKDLMYFLTATKVNHNQPFLQNIVDSYTRDRILAHYEKNKGYIFVFSD